MEQYLIKSNNFMFFLIKKLKKNFWDYNLTFNLKKLNSNFKQLKLLARVLHNYEYCEVDFTPILPQLKKNNLLNIEEYFLYLNEKSMKFNNKPFTKQRDVMLMILLFEELENVTQYTGYLSSMNWIDKMFKDDLFVVDYDEKLDKINKNLAILIDKVREINQLAIAKTISFKDLLNKKLYSDIDLRCANDEIITSILMLKNK